MRPVGLIVLATSAGLALGSGAGGPALAVHAPGDIPLAIAPEDVQRFREAGEDVVVIDLRPIEAFRQSRVPRARSVPVGDLRRRQGEIPRVGRVVLYGATPEEVASAYQALRDAGYRNVMVLAGGFPAWLRLGLPVESSP